MQRIAVIAGSSLSDTPPAPPRLLPVRHAPFGLEGGVFQSLPVSHCGTAGMPGMAKEPLSCWCRVGNPSTYYRTPAGKTLVDQHAAKSLVG